MKSCPSVRELRRRWKPAKERLCAASDNHATAIRMHRATKARFEARTWYVDARWGLLVERLIERIYLMRCQLVHGAATFGGKLNRPSLDRCTRMLRHLLAAVLLVIIDHGADEDWGEMCYPPIGS